MSDHYDRLGLPRRFAIDAAELERQYLARSRAVHPDFHAAGSSADQSASLELSAAVNEAYNTLRDPFTRADYLLTLEGGPSATEHKQVPQAFLTEMLDLRERVEDARGGETPCDAALASLGDEFAVRYDAQVSEIAGRFAELESLPSDGPDRSAIHLQIRTLLNAAKYLKGLIRDLHAAS